MKLRTVAIVQARMGSQRFPGKMLARLGPHPILKWVLMRVNAATALDDVILATSTNERDDVLADFAVQLGMRPYRGSEDDVLARFIDAAKSCGAQWVVRICADNPFVDPGEIDRLVDHFASIQCDYACNHLDRLGSGYADGFGAEILPLEILMEIARRTSEPKYREHVTAYLWDHQNDFRLTSVSAPAAVRYPELRFDVDHPDDLKKLERVVATGISLESPAGSIVRAAQTA